MPRVADSSQQPTRRYAVKCNYVGLFLSTCSLLNIASMPMKAYISEYLPWRAPPVMPDMFSNFSDFSAHMLAFDKQLYNNATLPRGATYVTDWTNDVQVMRHVVYPSVLAPLAREACLGSFLLGMPGLIFYTPAQMDLLCSLVASTNASELPFPPGGCFANALSSRTVGTSCYWIDHGNTLTNATEPDAVTLTYVYNATRYYKWLWCKFAYRILSTCFVIYRLWTQYYRHCLWLHRRLARASHFATPPTTKWRYELVLGDPTAIILMDPMVALVFLVDIWISIGNVGVAVLRASQNGDVTVNLLNILYLSRTVWFGYFALCLTAFCLRRYSKQHLFADVDTTMVAIGVTVYGPLISWLSGNVAALATAYQWCFTAPVAADKTSQQNELALGCVLYTLSIACMPVTYGFTAAFVRQHLLPRLGTRDYSSYLYNTVKNRALLSLVRPFRDATPSRGGAIYALFDLDPHCKNSPTLSLSGADCYLLCYENGELREKLRLGLLCSLRQARENPKSSVSETRTLSPYVFNVLDLQEPDVPRRMKEKSFMHIKGIFVGLQRPLESSPWCL